MLCTLQVCAGVLTVGDRVHYQTISVSERAGFEGDSNNTGLLAQVKLCSVQFVFLFDFDELAIYFVKVIFLTYH
jgi:hypothetical protein